MRKKIAMKRVVRAHPAELKSPIHQGQGLNQSYVIVPIEPHLSFPRASHYRRGDEALNHKRKRRRQGTHERKRIEAAMTLLFSKKKNQLLLLLPRMMIMNLS